nr:unnamed protein product [Callosobruchus analis]
MAGNRIFSRCIYCNNTFTSKLALDDHIVKKHPDFITAVSKKVHECTKCPYKTVITSHLKEHTLAKHPDITGTRVTSTCIYCNKTFVRKQTLDDHIVKSHPDFISSVSRKVHECTKCTYKTAITSYLKEHIISTTNSTTKRCIHCIKTFASNQSLDDHIVKRHPDFIESVFKKVHECTKCTFKTITTRNLKRHILAKHPDIAGNRVTITCIYCNKTFIRKDSLEDHIVKRHPDFIASVSRKVHECTECTFKTISNSQFRRHMVTHSDNVQFKCIHCNKTFASKQALDGHIIRRHPGFIASVSRKIHECTKCTYKTVSTSHLKEHIFAKHPDIAVNREISRCIYCHKTFVRKEALDDHVVKRHPDFIASVSRKVHECTKCTFKTISSNNLKEHILAKHPDIAGHRVTSTCIYCNKTFVRKETLDDHIVRTHPDFIASVSRKVHECTRCTYKTVRTSNLKEHIMANHPDIAGNRTTKRCIYCNKTFLRKQTLDDHMLKAHPDFLASVGKKVHECTKCTYKTVSITNLKKHMVNHPDTPLRHCIYCNKTFAGKRSFDAHVIKIHPDLIASVSSKIHECAHCSYKTVMANVLKEHILAKHRDIPNNLITKRCVYCSKVFVGSESLDDHIVKRHPHFIASVSRKIHGCTKCTYKTVSTKLFKEHITVNHPDQIVTCAQCGESFKSKTMLDDHTIKKHPSCVSSVTRKVYRCTKCDYKTTIIHSYKAHLRKHPETAGYCGYTCMHCSTAFKTDYSLNEHIIKKHPKFIASITRKIHACTKCTFKTVYTSSFQCHLLKHPETAATCIHCTEPFKSITMLDEHIIKKHPSSIPSITRKIHKCTTCDFSTTIHTEFKRHQLKHTDTYINRKSNICVHCNKSFLSKSLLDDHIVKKHPSFICSVTSKIRECTKCSYKTTIAGDLKKHMVQHPDVGDNEIFNRTMLDEHIIKKHPSSIPSITRKIHKCTTCDFNTTILTEFKRHQLKHTDRNSNICVHCNKSFLNKTLLDDHIVKKHPSFIYSVTSKIRECTKCSYKTTIAGYLKRHMVQHPDGIPICVHCNKTFLSKSFLDDHIVKKHPSFIYSVSSKIRERTKCGYKTAIGLELKKHMVQQHPDDLTCIHCNAMFKQKLYLQEHVIQNHPESVMSVTSRIHECTMCNFKTMLDDKLHEHLLKHTETTAVCIHCNEPFKSITMLDEHIIKKHPSSIPSITRKIHKCTTCDFSTTIHTEFKRHQLKHTDAYINRNSNICVHCNKSFLSKTLLDDHIVKKHPSFIYSVTSKIRECTKCSYKTTIAGDLKKHMMQHPDLSGGEIFNRCMYCDKTFIHKRTLGEHIIKNHPSYISSVTNKIHECTKCNFKTVDKRTLRRHGCQNVEVTELVLS